VSSSGRNPRQAAMIARRCVLRTAPAPRACPGRGARHCGT
jgi:hypothetical protein